MNKLLKDTGKGYVMLIASLAVLAGVITLIDYIVGY